MHTPFPKTPINPKRTKERRVRGRVRLKMLREDLDGAPFRDPRSYVTKGGRVRLFGDDYQWLRAEAYERARHERGGSFCECGCGKPAMWITASLADMGEVSHDEHGARKSDELDRVKWMRHECHMKRHNAGGKPCSRKPGRLMNQTEALAYWKGMACFCGDIKRECSSFCLQCLNRLDPQLQYDVQNATGEDYLRAMALAEQELLSWKPAEEKIG